MELLWKEFDEHQLVCGSRTERCGDCGLYVTLRDQLEHDLTCSALDNVSVPPRMSELPPNTSKETWAQWFLYKPHSEIMVHIRLNYRLFSFYSKNKSEL